jgi:hypothetical protein
VGTGTKRLDRDYQAMGENRMNDFLSVHQDDLFPLKQPSGLDAVRLCGIDNESKARREQEWRRQIISLNKKSELKELGL